MDRVKQYREIVERILRHYAAIPYAHGALESETVFDREADRYLLMVVGRDGKRRAHGCTIHVDIKDGKLWIHRDGIEYGMARELMDAGVPPEDIVLAFRAPERLGELPPTAAAARAARESA
jgi:hypothetical protein